MNYLVFLEARAGELEKILSGIKTMVIKEFDPAQLPVQPVMPGDSLYFLRDSGECAVRVTARVVRIFPFWKSVDGDLSQILKEMQPRLQLTEDQYQYWSAEEAVLIVGFDLARKIPAIHTAMNKVTDKSNWIPFERLSLVTESK